MANPNPKPISQADALRGSKLAKKAKKELRKMMSRELDIKDRQMWVDLVRSAAANPAVAGTVMYFVVLGVEGAMHAYAQANSPAQKAAAAANKDYLGAILDAFLSGFWLSFGHSTGVADVVTAGQSINRSIDDILKGLDLAALKLALILYIASGGNLAGILQSGGSLLTDLFKTAGMAKVVAP